MTPPLPPSCPVLRATPGGGAALGWAASAATVALALSGLAALAMTAAPAGESLGNEPVLILLQPAPPAIAALRDPAPDVAPAPAPLNAPLEQDTPPLPRAAAEPAPMQAAPRQPLPDPIPPDTAPPTAAAALPPPPDMADKTIAPREEQKAKSKPAAKPAARQQAAKPADKPRRKATAPASQAAAAAAPKAPAAASAGAGSRVAASYGAAVMKKIRKTRQKGAPARGTVVVGFVISEGGSLSSVKVARSSGSTALDQIAVDHIRRSAPFPSPPPGANRKFSFEFVGRK